MQLVPYMKSVNPAGINSVRIDSIFVTIRNAYVLLVRFRFDSLDTSILYYCYTPTCDP